MRDRGRKGFAGTARLEDGAAQTRVKSLACWNLYLLYGAWNCVETACLYTPSKYTTMNVRNKGWRLGTYTVIKLNAAEYEDIEISWITAIRNCIAGFLIMFFNKCQTIKYKYNISLLIFVENMQCVKNTLFFLLLSLVMIMLLLLRKY